MVWRLATAGIAAGCVALSGCSLILDFSDTTDAGPWDAAMGDAAEMDAGDPCTLFEPNDDISTPTILIAGGFGPAGICPGGDHDYYRFVVSGGQDVTIGIFFDNMAGQGDLELRLYDSVGAQVDQSQTFDDNEQIVRTLALGNQLAADSYTFEVYGVLATTQNSYTIQLTIGATESFTAVPELNFGATWPITTLWSAAGTPGHFITKWSKRPDCLVGPRSTYSSSPGETCIPLVDDGTGVGFYELAAANTAQALACTDFILGEWIAYVTFYDNEADCMNSANGRDSAAKTSIFYDELSTGCMAPGVTTAATAAAYDLNCQ